MPSARGLATTGPATTRCRRCGSASSSAQRGGRWSSTTSCTARRRARRAPCARCGSTASTGSPATSRRTLTSPSRPRPASCRSGHTPPPAAGAAGGGQDATVSVFTLDPDGSPRHFYTPHPTMAEDIDQRGIDLLAPVWHILDLTPQGSDDWYAQLGYGRAAEQPSGW